METTALENLLQKGDFEAAIVWCRAKIAQNDGQIYLKNLDQILNNYWAREFFTTPSLQDTPLQEGNER